MAQYGLFVLKLPLNPSQPKTCHMHFLSPISTVKAVRKYTYIQVKMREVAIVCHSCPSEVRQIVGHCPV